MADPRERRLTGLCSPRPAPSRSKLPGPTPPSDLAPNLAVTGSPSALLWFQAGTVSIRPSLATVTGIGLTLVPCSIAAALVALGRVCVDRSPHRREPDGV